MSYLFYDLETTDLNFVGQILNYAFIEIDDNWNQLSELCGKVKISRTQLPSPEAILSNRIDVLKHDGDLECIAMKKIRNYIDKIIETRGHVKLIGFNSSRFDNHFLRTSMIRNGVSPYFSKNISYGDVLHIAQKLSIINDEFKNLVGIDKEGKIDLSLENLSKLHGILKGKQTHNSKEDVLLTIELSKEFKRRYNIDIKNFKSFEAKNPIECRLFPDWEAKYHILHSEDNSNCATMVRLCYDRAFSLWINLEKYLNLPKTATKEEKKQCVSWYNANTSFFITKEKKWDEKTLQNAERARKELKYINLSNFFPPKNCDIEQFIYEMSFDDYRALENAIWNKNFKELKSSNDPWCRKLYLRFKFSQCDLNEKLLNLLKKYSIYRYGGRMKLDKFNFDVKYEEGVYNESFHPTFNELKEKIKMIIDDPNSSKEDKNLMESLDKFYNNSAIYKIAGKELEKINRVKKYESENN